MERALSVALTNNIYMVSARARAMNTDLLHYVLPLGLLTAVGLWWWCGRCSAAHVRALRSDDDLGLRGRWSRWRWDTRVQYSKLPI
jgi:hypothetical protein